MLILLVSIQRGQTISALSLDNMSRTDEEIVFKIDVAKLKQGRPGYKPKLLRFKKYSVPELCIFTHLGEYIDRTKPLRRGENQVFITCMKPHHAASRDTISRWVRCVMTKAGIDTNLFKPGSTRAAAGSKAAQAGTPLQEILGAGGWSRETTFFKWYKKDIV